MIFTRCAHCNKFGLKIMFKKAEWVWGKPIWADNIYCCSMECANKFMEEESEKRRKLICNTFY